MGFQRLLAGRYIFAQKRHSVLTICSIVAALTLMTMLFTGFSTILTCLRNQAYETAPYHCMIHSVTNAEADAIRKTEGIASCTTVQNKREGTLRAVIFFDKGIKSEITVLNNAFEKAGMDITAFDYEYYTTNFELMVYDMVGEDAWYLIADLFAAFYVFVVFLAMVMRLIIDTAFEISSKERERQFGVLQSIGATPRQIVGIITMEGSLLSIIGIPLGLLCGTGLAYLAFSIIRTSGLTDAFFTAQKAEKIMEFNAAPLMLVVAALTGFFWVWLSAYSTGMRIIRMSPMQAISSRSNTVKKVKKFTLLGMLFGWKGKLAARNVRRAPKRFAVTVVSLTLSIAFFASFSCVMAGVNGFYEEVFASYGLTHDFEMYGDDVHVETKSFRRYAEVLEDSGYFENISLSYGEAGHYTGGGASATMDITYVDENAYHDKFLGNPPIPYEDFAKLDGYMLLQYSQETAEDYTDLKEKILPLYALDSYPAEVITYKYVSPEEYAAMTKEEQRGLNELADYDEKTGKQTITGYSRFGKTPVEFNIAYKAEMPESGLGGIFEALTLIAPMERYETNDYQYYGDANNRCVLGADLAEDADHREAVRFLESVDGLVLMVDMYEMKQQSNAVLALVRIIGVFILAMVAVIAVVNMVNIISTGLLNRRSELAAMQCVGMTARQLLGMSVVECLQYVLTAGIAASLLCAGMMLVSEYLMHYIATAGMPASEPFELTMNYAEPMGIIWLCAALAFAVALVTTLLSLRNMKQQPLVDQIRSVD